MPLFCDKCGYQNKDSAKFCLGCGGEVVATTATGTLIPGVILDKRYEIQCLIKSGGMGAVYKALDHRFDKAPCAVKEMLSLSTDPAGQKYFIDSFKKEAKTLHGLKHSSLPGVKDYFIEAGRYYLVMDYIEGKDLDTVLHGYNGKGVPEDIVIEWSKQILEALDYLHNQSPPIVYRDMKPGNIMLQNSDRKIMLIDFGIARAIHPENQATMTIIGTPAYAPQEIFQGKPEPRSDIYSLGATMHCLLTGVIPLAPFTFKPVIELNPQVSQELNLIVMRALAMSAENRFENAREMLKALDKLSLLPQSSQTEPWTTVPTVFPFSSAGNSLQPIISPQQPAPVDTVQPEYSVPGNCSPSMDIVAESKISGNKKISLIIGIVLLFLAGIIGINTLNNTPSHYISLARKEKNPDASIDYYKKAIELAEQRKDLNSNIEAHKELSDLYMNKKDYKSARAELDRLSYLGEKNLDTKYIDVGKRFLEQDLFKEATDCFNALKNPDRKIKLEVLKSLSDYYMKKGNYEEAINKNNEILKLSASDIQAYITRGTAYYKLKKYEEAISSFNKAIKLKPGEEQKKAIASMSFDCYMNTGNYYKEQTKYKEACENFQNALDLKKDNGEAKNGLAGCYLKQGEIFFNKENYEEAKKYFDKVITLKTGDTSQKAKQYLAQIDTITQTVIPVEHPYIPPPYNPPPPDGGSTGGHQTIE